MKTILRKFKKEAMLIPFMALNHSQPKFECPVCNFVGPFATKKILTGDRVYAQCPKCGSLERHRIQHLVLQSLFQKFDLSKARMLHFAPEHFFMDFFRKRVGEYKTADLAAPGVDYQVDLRKLPFPQESFDFVYASHVLEHIDEDAKAIAEISRILSPGGIAVLPVPIVAKLTIEYPEPNPFEEYHVRAPGPDYFNRYNPHFQTVQVYHSSDFPEKHQCFIYEDRSVWPTAQCPLLPKMLGKRHEDIVPVCFVTSP
jgi:predicted SAM-dependent methyltransferase